MRLSSLRTENASTHPPDSTPRAPGPCTPSGLSSRLDESPSPTTPPTFTRAQNAQLPCVDLTRRRDSSLSIRAELQPLHHAGSGDRPHETRRAPILGRFFVPKQGGMMLRRPIDRRPARKEPRPRLDRALSFRKGGGCAASADCLRAGHLSTSRSRWWAVAVCSPRRGWRGST